MPRPRSAGWNQGKTVSQFQLRNLRATGGGSGGSTSAPITRAIDVTTSEWTADSSGYIGAPNDTIGPGGNGEAQRASVAHSFGSANCMIVGYRDENDRVWDASDIVDQKLSSTDRLNVIDIWLPFTPTDTITVYVAFFAA